MGSLCRECVLSRLNFADAVDFADAWDLAEVGGEAREVAEVEGFDDELDVGGGAVGVAVGVDGADVGVVVGDGGGEFLEHAGAVFAGDDEADGVFRRLVAGRGNREQGGGNRVPEGSWLSGFA